MAEGEVTTISELETILSEPIDKVKFLLSYDAQAGGEHMRSVNAVRITELCARMRTKITTALRYEYKCIMWHQSLYRVTNPEEKMMKALMQAKTTWVNLYFNGDDEWWNLTKEKQIEAKRFRQLMRMDKNPSDLADDVLMDNPWFDSKDLPQCHSNFAIFRIGMTTSGEMIGILFEMETLANWTGNLMKSIVEVTKTIPKRGSVRSLKRKLEGIMEFLKDYSRDVPRYKEVSDDLQTAALKVLELEQLVEVPAE